MTQSTASFLQRRVAQPPALDDYRLRAYLLQLADAINDLPPMSTFSHATPESKVSAIPGTIGVNVASGHTLIWYKQSGFGTTGWDSLATTRAY